MSMSAPPAHLSRASTGPQTVYLDHNATTPPAREVVEKVAQWSGVWGNPSSIHWAGRQPKTVLRQARLKIAKLIGARPLELVFTSGGSEANNLAIKGHFAHIQTQPQPLRRRLWITTRVEHPSVIKAFEWIQREGGEVAWLEVNRQGEIHLEQYMNLLQQRPALISVMLANNETGTIFPIKKMAREAHKVGARFHTDAVQALGKWPLQVEHLGVDFASFSGHKFYALRGVGVLFCRRGGEIQSLIDGGAQERHRRAGTENLLAIQSLAHMAEQSDLIPVRAVQMATLRDHLQQRIESEIAGVRVNGFAAQMKRLPNTLNVSIEGVDGESLLMNLDLKGFAISAGSACSAGNPEPSPTLLAMGLAADEAQSSLRVSLGWGSTRAEIDGFVEELKAIVARLRGLSRRGCHETLL